MCYLGFCICLEVSLAIVYHSHSFFGFSCCLVAKLCLTATPWTVAHQAPLSVGFPIQEYCSRLPFSSPGDHPNWWIVPMSAALAGGFFTIEPPGKPSISVSVCHLWGWMNCRCGGGGGTVQLHAASCPGSPGPTFAELQVSTAGKSGDITSCEYRSVGGPSLAGRQWLGEVRHPGPQWSRVAVWAPPCKVRTEPHQGRGFCLTCTTSGAVAEPRHCTWSPSLFAFLTLCFSSSSPQGPPGEREWREQTQMIQILRGHFPDTSGSKGEH